VGLEDTILITRTNLRTNLYNQGVRNQILWREENIAQGDRIMVTKNNYFWSEQYDNLPFLANGDILEIVRLRNERELYGFRFADASLRSVDYNWEIDVTLWLDTLFTDSPEANFALQKQLFLRVAEDYPEIRNKRELWKEVMKSPYYNALQIRFAYAVTCHKAQGGQWKRVFIDPGKVSDEQLGEDFYRWFYTALTRAQEHVYLINFPPKK
jgi:exodeoxyribonuclease-5